MDFLVVEEEKAVPGERRCSQRCRRTIRATAGQLDRTAAGGSVTVRTVPALRALAGEGVQVWHAGARAAGTTAAPVLTVGHVPPAQRRRR